MKRFNVLRFGATIILFLTTILALTSPAAAIGTGTITLHSRLCPSGQPTSDIFDDCHSHLPTQLTSYTVDDGAALNVDADGNLTFSGLATGAHTIAQQEGVPLDFAHLRVFCSDSTTGSPVTEVAVDVNKFDVTAIAGDEIICDVYTIPENASGLPTTGTITLHSRICPAGQPTTDIFDDCHGYLPSQTTTYSLDGGVAKAVNTRGNVAFTGLTAGLHTIAQQEGVPLDFAHLRVFCSDLTAGTGPVELAVDVNEFSVTAVAGDKIVCDVYTIPENASGLPQTGSIILHSRICPAGQPNTNIFDDCHGHLPTQATSYSVDDGTPMLVGSDGNVSFTGLTAGTHSIAQVEGVPLDFAYLRVFCSNPITGVPATEVSVDVNTFFVSAVAGDEIVCDVYTIPGNASGQ